MLGGAIMQWLTALLAFATTMLMFAIIVSTLVEMIHRIWKLRASGLQLMLKNLYSRVILPKLPAPKPGEPALLTPEEFAALIMENRAVAEKGKPSDGLVSRFLRWFVDWAVVTDIPVEVFTQKLASSRLVGAANVLTDEVVKDISQKYEAFGKEASMYFESRARLFSVVVAFAVAWMFYVHPYKLAVSYLKSPEIAEAVADKASQYTALEAKLDAAAKQQAGAGSADDLKAAISALDKELDDSKAKMEELKTLGAAVGWPDNSGLEKCAVVIGTTDCAFTAFDTRWTRPSIVSILWLLLGGLLVGLGAPFWAQAVSSLTASRDVSRRIADIVTPGSAGGGAAPQGVVAPAPTESTPVASFKVSRAAGKKNVKK
ncbi:hypothetical protein MesoLj113a_39630 [Mesorhizobium sp. 113-1-2]|nr:hypothetical protein MesoLj113a_39630 [Mesorhizobium sp. 113-1-2]